MRYRDYLIIFAFLGFVFLGAPLARANETPKTPSDESACIQENILHNLFFKRIKRHKKSQELGRLLSKTFGDYFDESVKEAVTGDGHEILRANYTDKDVKRFEKDWDRLLDLSHDFGLINADHVREGLVQEYGKPYLLITPSNIENVYKRPKGGATTLHDWQVQFSIEYTDYKELQHGEFPGIQKHISPSSPYSVTYKSIRAGKSLWATVTKYVVLSLGLGFASPLSKPIIGPYTEAVDSLTSEVLDSVVPERRDQARASRELALMIQKKGQLIREARALDFTKMPTKAVRLKQWAELDRRLKENQNQITEQLAKIKIPPGKGIQDKPVSPFDVQNRLTDLRSNLSILANDRSIFGQYVKLETLATLKAVELLDTSSKTDDDAAEKIIDRMVDQLANDPKKFQAFIRKYLAAQWAPPAENRPR
jgi:hypothetical protein